MLIAGTDEVGYGALAGPIVAVTVALEVPSIDWWPLLQVDDSKKLTESRREELRTLLPEWLIRHEGEVGIGIAQVPYINTKGYSMAHRKALEDSVRKATKGADVRPELLIVDGNISISGYPWKQRSEPKADANHFVVAAASILAKIFRDDIMTSLDEQFPEYGFAQHKGYGTAVHKEALKKHGLSSQHRTKPCGTVLGKVISRRTPKGW